MKRKITFLGFTWILFTGVLFLIGSSYAQTTGTLTCTFSTTSTGGYTPKNCIAVWIENSSGTFIKTKIKSCSSGNYDHLTTWTGKSGQSVVDATSGGTRSANGALNFSWNGTDVSSTLVADGPYKVWVEFSWASSGKIVQSFSFTKGTSIDHQTPADLTNLTGIILDWNPSTIGIDENKSNIGLTVSPNPITNQGMIKYHINEFSDVTISLYDLTGKLVYVLFDDNQTAGNYCLPLSSKGNIKSGAYFVKINTGKTQHTERILVIE